MSMYHTATLTLARECTCRCPGIKLLVAASALEFRHQGSETFVCPAGTEAHTEATARWLDIQSICQSKSNGWRRNEVRAHADFFRKLW